MFNSGKHRIDTFKAWTTKERAVKSLDTTFLLPDVRTKSAKHMSRFLTPPFNFDHVRGLLTEFG